MNSNYKSGNLRQTVAAVVCAIVFGSTFLAGAVAPAETAAAHRTAITRTAA
jgi:hypothetical protein